ncbi:MAG: ABC transporter permease [Thermoanaerobaculia bacterium]
MTRPLSQLRLILRRLAQAPLFTALTVLTLGVGIGANSAVFSVLNGVLLRPLPYPESDRLVGIWHRAPGVGEEHLPQAPALYFTYREQAKSFEESGMWQSVRVAVTGLDQPQQVDVVRLTEGVFPVLGMRPQLGRQFTEADMNPDGAATVMLSDAYFRKQFAGDPGVIGKMLKLDGVPRQVIGVTPAGFRFLEGEPKLFLPIRQKKADLFFGQFGFYGIARLKPGVSLAQASADMARLIPVALGEYPMPTGFTRAMMEKAQISPEARPIKLWVIGDVGKVLWVIFGTVGLVLLVACANVANLFLVRSEGRQQELAIQTALGASRRRLAGELLGESLLLGLAGAVVGMVLAWLGLNLLVEIAPAGLPRLSEIRLDGAAIAFTLGISVFSALLFGSVAVARLGASGLALTLREAGRSGSVSRGRVRARNALAVAQIALALVLLVGSGLLLRTFQALRAVDPGFARPQEVLSFRLEVPEAEVGKPAEVVQLYQAIAERLRAIPGVSSVGLSSGLPMDSLGSFDPVFVEDHPPADGQVPPLHPMRFVGENYLETLKTPLLAGRSLRWADVEQAAPVAVVSETFARAYWPNPQDALGKRIRETPSSVWREIVGVAADLRDVGVDQPTQRVVYWPLKLEKWWDDAVYVERTMNFVVRSSRVGEPGFLDEVQRAVWSVNGNLPLASVRTLGQLLEGSMARTSFTALMLAIAAATALLLGAVGTYGVTSFVAAQRTREIGVRMALGARRQDIARLVLRHGLLLGGLGVALGSVAAASTSRLLTSLLYGVRPLDPGTFLVVALVMAAVALLATYGPARRAASQDPIVGLQR